MALGTLKNRKHLAAAGLVASLCCAAALSATPAYAATMEELQAKANEAVAAFEAASAKVDEVQSQIDENQAKVDEIQAKLPAQQEAASDSIRSLYKMQQSTPGLVNLLLSSDSFTDFITTYQYINALQRSNVEALQQLETTEEELRDAQSQLEVAKAEADSEKETAQQTLVEAENAIQELNAQLAAQAAAEAAAAAAASGEAQGNNSISNQPSDPTATNGTEVSTDGTWMSGYASAYSLADNTGWDATASGETLTDDSVTVAVPASQSYLLGRSVEISWNGITITARVTDTGGFAKYGRVLDLAGGCWKAFGFSSPNDWGVRLVSYRFL